MAENNTNKLGDITKTSLESIRSMLDANTIIGDPIETASGTCIIPISKISVGYASGGVDYLKKDAPVSNGKPVYNKVVYEYETPSGENYRITYDRHGDINKTCFVDVLPKPLGMLAKLIGFDGGYFLILFNQ